VEHQRLFHHAVDHELVLLRVDMAAGRVIDREVQAVGVDRAVDQMVMRRAACELRNSVFGLAERPHTFFSNREDLERGVGWPFPGSRVVLQRSARPSARPPAPVSSRRQGRLPPTEQGAAMNEAVAGTSSVDA